MTSWLDNYDSFTYNLAQYLGALFFTFVEPPGPCLGERAR